MEKLKIDITHCYGIHRLQADLNFEKSAAIAIYAPNGVMKSSLAKTFQDIASGENSGDRIFKDRSSVRNISHDAGIPLAPEKILVVHPYGETLGDAKQMSTLLVNSQLRQEFENATREVEDATKVLIRALQQQLETQKDIKEEISFAFLNSRDSKKHFLTAIARIENEVAEEEDSSFASVPYDIIFDKKVLAFLDKEKQNINDYIGKYNELIDESEYFKRGVFTHYNATVIAKSLDTQGFFRAQHFINLNSENPKKIETREQLEDFLNEEKARILSNPELQKTFGGIDSQLNKNRELRAFQEYLSDNREIITKLEDIGLFMQEIWKHCCIKHKDKYDALMSKIKAVKEKTETIKTQAKSEQTLWEKVIEIYNRRFHVPFRLKITNMVDAILGEAPELAFEFSEGDNSQTLEREEILQVLSTGERKAFYILNFIFDIEARKKEKANTLIVIDDIADSFDYKNKYSIVQYLKEISEHDNFKQLILTHNFDFFRTIESRFVEYKSCFFAHRNEEGISLKQAVGIKNIFVKDWKKYFVTSPKKQIASIPFMRNIIEYTKGEADEDYKKLTSLLHVQPETSSFTKESLYDIYEKLFGQLKEKPNDRTSSDRVIEIIYTEADNSLNDTNDSNLETKIVLSIAARLKAEQYMIGQIGEPTFTNNIEKNQTTALLGKFSENNQNKQNEINVLEDIVLMTPENIHLNSFMYEPIIDMSSEHLKEIYRKIKEISEIT